EAALEVAPAEQWKQAQEIVNVVDGLPLALDQAGAYIKATQCGLKSYLEQFNACAKIYLDKRGTDTRHTESVGRSWSLSFDQVKSSNNPLAADLLRCCAFLAPDAIPEKILIGGAPELGSHFQSLTKNRALLDE